jgi:hypothetical protein
VWDRSQQLLTRERQKHISQVNQWPRALRIQNSNLMPDLEPDKTETWLPDFSAELACLEVGHATQRSQLGITIVVPDCCSVVCSKQFLFSSVTIQTQFVKLPATLVVCALTVPSGYLDPV